MDAAASKVYILHQNSYASVVYGASHCTGKLGDEIGPPWPSLITISPLAAIWDGQLYGGAAVLAAPKNDTGQFS